MTSPRSPQPDPLRRLLRKAADTLDEAVGYDGRTTVSAQAQRDKWERVRDDLRAAALTPIPSPDTDLRATLLREIVEAIGDRTFVLDSNEYGQRVVQFGRGESVSSATGKPLGPGQMAVNGGDVEDPLVSALARAVELLGPDRVTVR